MNSIPTANINHGACLLKVLQWLGLTLAKPIKQGHPYRECQRAGTVLKNALGRVPLLCEQCTPLPTRQRHTDKLLQ